MGSQVRHHLSIKQQKEAYSIWEAFFKKKKSKYELKIRYKMKYLLRIKKKEALQGTQTNEKKQAEKAQMENLFLSDKKHYLKEKAI